MKGTHPQADLPCQRVVEMVTDYLEGKLGALDHAQLEQHLALCDACVQYVEQNRKLVAALRNLPSPAAPAASRTAALRAFRELQETPAPADQPDGVADPEER